MKLLNYFGVNITVHGLLLIMVDISEILIKKNLFNPFLILKNLLLLMALITMHYVKIELILQKIELILQGSL